MTDAAEPPDPSTPTDPADPGPMGLATSSMGMSPRLLASRDTADLPPRRRELRRIASASRDLIERLVGTDATEEELVEAADALEALVGRFRSDGPRSVYDGIAEVAMAGGDTSAFFDHSPIIGRANPLSPPMELTVHEDHIEGRVRFGAAYEGPPGCVHGGYVAAVFDELLGSAQTFSGAPGMTGTLKVVYRSPTPLHADLTLRGEYLRSEGRKVFTAGQMYAGDTLTAEAEGIFISIGMERFRELREARNREAGW